jgi:hypothetical protein
MNTIVFTAKRQLDERNTHLYQIVPTSTAQSKIECDRELTFFITLVPSAIYPFRSVKLLPKIVKLGHK